ncbi:MAG: nucleotidyltransferase [Chitinophagaceae bacterium]|nr:MAG: nucleotidyltransferase [Chitinophagaceae bacterium]
MIYTEEQLSRFCNPPAKYKTDQIISTHEKIRGLIEAGIDKEAFKKKFELADYELNISLQGSYRNSTNVSNTSDVDLLVEFDSVYYYDTSSLPLEQVSKREEDSNPSQFDFNVFKSLINIILEDEYSTKKIERGNKSIKYIGDEKTPFADVVPCVLFRKYTHYHSASNNGFIEGIKFKCDDGAWISNYPKQQYMNLSEKNLQSNSCFKSGVRMFKTLKENMIEVGVINENTIKSYHVENLLYNIDNTLYQGNNTDTFRAILDRLIVDFNDNSIDKYKCSNGVEMLFADNILNKGDYKTFLLGLSKIRDNNAF